MQRITVGCIGICILALALLVVPLATRAQQPATPVVGFLNTQSPELFAHLLAGFRQGLSDAGYVEGQNVTIEYRWAQNHYERLPALAADLVGRHVAVIAATGGSVSALAAKPATATIPIVFVMGDLDPVHAGLVASLSRPGGNITGVMPITSLLGPKQLELLHEMVPKATVVGLLVNPDWPDAETQASDVQKAAHALGLHLQVLRASTEPDIETAFTTLRQQQVGALLVGNDAFFNSRRAYLVALAARYAMPTIYSFREFAVAGGLMSYAPSLVEAYRHAGLYTGKILKGVKPADLPVMQPMKFEFAINLKTAKALGLTIPPSLLVLADEVIQ
jgi:putative ABC transport system substrate-binding protein